MNMQIDLEKGIANVGDVSRIRNPVIKKIKNVLEKKFMI